ncbi:MAG: MaoC family dehydratase [Catenulispora sp.]|nr:MaoC family dehydratase [Catenulispora sp.]
MTPTETWDDLRALEGTTFTGEWFTVDADRLEQFDHATYTDENPDLPGGTDYPDGLVEGFHLLALLDHLVTKALVATGRTVYGWNYGFDKVRFTSPVLAGQPIRVQGRISEVAPRADGCLALLDVQIEVEGREKPACIAAWRILWMRGEEA